MRLFLCNHVPCTVTISFNLNNRTLINGVEKASDFVDLSRSVAFTPGGVFPPPLSTEPVFESMWKFNLERLSLV